MFTTQRRARRSDSLATAVTALLDELQCPVSTTAVRIMLIDRGRPVTAEHLGRLAGYQREDVHRTHIAPTLCWALHPDGTPTNPRWWARGDWRLERRILTAEAKPIWLTHLASRLCLDLAEQPDGRDSAIITLALSSVAQLLGSQIFDVPTTDAGWLALRKLIYREGVLSNMTGATAGQSAAEADLTRRLTGAERFFGRATG